ncbi:MAG: SAM hydrolase/SAM-dependent halogenase family protein [Planctomycetaceae bacterium]
MPFPPIALLTDFGLASGYAAQMKGVILGLLPDTVIVDISHDIAPQNIPQGAVVLDSAIDAFPRETVFVAVVDPGVGGSRRLVGVEAGGQRFLAPDNGLLSELLARMPPGRVHHLTESRFWRHPVSNTFHGRDILAPVAARWCGGEDLAAFGPALPPDQLVRLTALQPRLDAGGVAGEVVAVDGFGNLITNIREAHVPVDQRASAVVCVGSVKIAGVCRYYSERPTGASLALFGSSGRLELAINGASAASQWGLSPGAAVEIRLFTATRGAPR